VKEARKIIEDEEIEKKLKSEDMVKKTLRAVEQDGVVFIDEIDKVYSIFGRGSRNLPYLEVPNNRNRSAEMDTPSTTLKPRQSESSEICCR
jgi:hypothetical protein